MSTTTAAGNITEPVLRFTQSGKAILSFGLAMTRKINGEKQTTWIDVTKWGKGSEGLAKMLRKGSKVAVSGELSLREHEGKTYVQCRADNVKVLSTPDGPRRDPDGSRGSPEPEPDYDDGGDIPFITSNSIY